MFMTIAEEIGSRKSGTLSQAQKRGRVIADEERYVVYKFVDGSEILFNKTSTCKVKSRSYTIYN